MTNNTDTLDCVNSVFQQPWWLEAVAPGQWQSLEVVHEGTVCARMPIVIGSRYGCRTIDKPRLTHTLGPWLKPTEGKSTTRIAKEKEWMLALIDQLPPFDYFIQNWHYSLQNWLPFYWKGFEASVSYTYVITDLSDLDAVRAGYGANMRQHIRQARKKVAVRSDLGVDVLWRQTEKSFGRWNRRPPYSFEYLARVDAACEANQARKILCAEDAQGNIHGALLLVYDARAAYYLVSGADPAFRNSGAMALLIDEAIQFATSVSRVFDFEGSMVEPIEQFVRDFGGSPKPHFTIRGYSRRMRLIEGMRSMLRKAAG